MTYIRHAVCAIIFWGDNVENRTEYKNAWKKEHRDSYLLTMQKGRKEKIKAHAKSTGYDSLNAYINELIERDIDK